MSQDFFSEGNIIKRAVPADHNCLFSSIAYCLENKDTSQPKSQSLRNYISQHILQNPSIYTSSFLDKDPIEYAAWIQDSMNWGGAIELAIFAEKYACEIGAFNVQSGGMECYGEGCGYQQRIYVMYDGLHYDPVVLTFDESLPSDCDVTIFHPEDVYVYSQGQSLCGMMNKKRQFTDTSRYSLICLVCGEGLNGNQGAVNHAKQTGHQNFAQNEGGQSLGTNTNYSSQDQPVQAPQLSQEEREERLKALEERIKEKKAAAAEQAKIDERENEKKRREFGQLLQEQKQERERQEMINEAARIQKEKRENKIARDKIRAKIEQDKLNRQNQEERTPETAPVQNTVANPEATVTNTATNKKDTSTIQFRAPGKTMKETFPLDTTLQDLEFFVQANVPGLGAFSMSTTFPRRTYTRDEYHLTLQQADLSGRPQIMINKISQ